MPFVINQSNERSEKLAASRPGVVKYAGLSSKALLVAIVAIGTCGFSLFGYGGF